MQYGVERLKLAKKMTHMTYMTHADNPRIKLHMAHGHMVNGHHAIALA
jgi:hypothetical protein